MGEREEGVGGGWWPLQEAFGSFPDFSHKDIFRPSFLQPSRGTKEL